MTDDYVCYQCGGFGCHHCNFIRHGQTGASNEKEIKTDEQAKPKNKKKVSKNQPGLPLGNDE